MKLLQIAPVALLIVAVVYAKEEEEKRDKDNFGTVIGIDLGTTYSWCAWLSLFKSYFFGFYKL